MVNRVHGYTTNSGPARSLCLVLEVGATSLQDRLVHTTSTSDNANHSTAVRGDDLLCAGWELNSGYIFVGVVRNDGGVVARASCEGSTITNLLLNVADNGTLRHGTNRHHVTNGQLCLLSGVNVLARVHALSGEEKLLVQLELVGVSENHTGKRSATSGVVDDLLNYTSKVSVSLGIIKRSVLDGALSVLYVGPVDMCGTPSLSPNNTTHYFLRGWKKKGLRGSWRSLLLIFAQQTCDTFGEQKYGWRSIQFVHGLQ